MNSTVGNRPLSPERRIENKLKDWRAYLNENNPIEALKCKNYILKLIKKNIQKLKTDFILKTINLFEEDVSLICVNRQYYMIECDLFFSGSGVAIKDTLHLEFSLPLEQGKDDIQEAIIYYIDGAII